MFTTTNFIDILFNDKLSSSEDLLNLKLIIWFGVLSIVFLSSFFNDPIYGEIIKIITDLILILGAFILGGLYMDFYFGSNGLVEFVQTNGDWKMKLHPVLSLWLILLIVMDSFSLFRVIEFKKALDLPSWHRFKLDLESLSAITFILGTILILINAIILHTWDHVIRKYVDISGTSLIFIGVISMIYSILSNPLNVIYLRNKSEVLLKNKLVGWALFSNTDSGPKLFELNSTLREDFRIPEDVLVKFGIQSLIFAYNENEFVNSVSISPFSSMNEFEAISLTFIHKNEELADIRMNKQALSVFILIIPSFLLPLFSKHIGYLNKLNGVISYYVSKTKNINELRNSNLLTDLTKDALDLIF